MASFNVHEDQENRALDVPLKTANSMVLQPKRSVLEALDNKPDRFGKNKQVLSRHFTSQLDK